MDSKMKELRDAKGLSQKEVAAILKMPVRTYGSYERGERTLSLDVAAQIADVLDVTIDELMNRDYRVPVLTLTWEERTLIRLYRGMDDMQKKLLMSTATQFAVASEKDEQNDERAVHARAVDAVIE